MYYLNSLKNNSTLKIDCLQVSLVNLNHSTKGLYRLVPKMFGKHCLHLPFRNFGLNCPNLLETQLQNKSSLFKIRKVTLNLKISNPNQNIVILTSWHSPIEGDSSHAHKENKGGILNHEETLTPY